MGCRLSHRWLWTLLWLGAPSLQAQTLPERESLARSFDHSNGLWAARFWQDKVGRGEDSFFLLDRGQFNKNREGEARSEQASVVWTLGLGEESEYFGQFNASGAWQRRVGPHQLTLNLGVDAAHFAGNAAFQDLEAQYLLAPLDENGALTPGRTIEKSQEWGVDFGIADSFRVSPTLDLLGNVQARRNEYRLDARRRDLSELLLFGSGFSKRWSRVSWDTNAQISQLSFRDLQSEDPANDTQRQELSSISSFVSSALGPRLRAGLGYQLLESSFTAEEKRRVEGPGATLGQSSDGRFAWQARLSLLREQTSAASEAQAFGGLSFSYLLSPRSNLTFDLSKEVDLERSYSSITSEQLLLSSEQQYTVQTSLGWNFQTGRSRWALLLVRDEQKYLEGELDSLSASSSVSYRLSRASDFTQRLELRRNTSEALISTLTASADSSERRVLIASSSWRHRWAAGSASFRPYVSLDFNYEVLNLRAIDENLYRATLILALGQELRL